MLESSFIYPLSAALWNSIGLPLSAKGQELTAGNIAKIVRASTGWGLELGNIHNPLDSPKYYQDQNS